MEKINPMPLTVFIILIMLYLTFTRNATWCSDLSLWQDTISKQKIQKIRTLLNLGNAYKEIGDYQKAEECYRSILQKAPNFHQARVFRAVMLIKLDRYEEALKELETIEYFYKNVLPNFPEKKKAVERFIKEEDLYNTINELRKKTSP
jgi:tetratricopeptide (TPR) repeat protein